MAEFGPMTDDSHRSIDLVRVARGQYEATNSRGGKLVFGHGGEDLFSPVELMLTAIAGCSAIDVDYITSKRSEPSRFELTMSADKVRDENGNRLVNLSLSFDVRFPDDADGNAALEVLPRSVAQSHDRLCTVSRTIEVGTPITVTIAEDQD